MASAKSGVSTAVFQMKKTSHARVRVARARPRDFLAIAALDRVAWRQNRHPEFIPDGEHVWRMWCEFALVYVARRGARLAGVILAFPTLDGRFCVHKVMVARPCRGQGIGSRLFAVLLKELDRRGVAAFLTADPVNAAAVALYAKWGFRRRKLVNGFYRHNEDRLVLTRPAPRPRGSATR